MTRVALRLGLALLLLCAAVPAVAQVRAWLDRERIELGQTATLSIESTGTAAPDYAPLLADFDLSGRASRQQFEWVNGRMQARSTHQVVLRPRGAGRLRIPALRVGAQRTAPLLLAVSPPGATPAPQVAGREVFIESGPDDADPYVQQSVGWTVRLYALQPLVSGRLDQDTPEGASLQRVGDDVQYRRDIGGRAWQVIERRYLLVPERSGELAIPPARFEGRAVGGMLDRLFGDGQVDLRASAPARVLRVRPIPDDAPLPWLPLHALTMEYRERPSTARVGQAATLVVQVLADGAGRAQMPGLELPAPPGAQVFAERAQVDEAIVEGRPRARLTRRFSIVPAREGPLRIEGPGLAWWDVRAGRARTSRLPAIELVVAPGAAGGPDTEHAPPAATGIPGAGPSWTAKRLLALGAGLAVLALAGFALHRRRAAAPSSSSSAAPADVAPTAPGSGSSSARPAGPTLARALALGDLADIEAALRAAAPVQGGLEAVAEALDDADQRRAVLALRDARWGRGEPASARTRLRAAFASGARWRDAVPRTAEPLPPLYPPP